MLLDYQLAKRRLSTNQFFLISGGKMERNLKALMMKATKSLDSEAKSKVLRSINKSLDKNYNIVMKNLVA